MALMDEGTGQRVAHFPGRAVRQEANRIDRLPGRASGDENFHAGILIGERKEASGSGTRCAVAG